MKIKLSILLYFAILALANGEHYSFAMVSDLHFGSPESFYTGQKKEWRSRKDIFSAKRAEGDFKELLLKLAKENPRFLVVTGDLIEGYTKGETTHKEELNKAFATLKKYVDKPIYLAVGNHDIAGLGGFKGFYQVVSSKYSTLMLPNQPQGNHFFFQMGKDVFIFLDIYSKSDTNLAKVVKLYLDSLSTPPRYIFVALHSGVIPFAYKHAQELREILLEKEAIILCGHTHMNELIEFSQNGKTMTQITLNTRPPKITPYEEEGIAAFIPKFEKKRLKSESDLKQFHQEWVPFLTRYHRFYGQCYGIFQVSNSGVTLKIEFPGSRCWSLNVR